MSVEKLFQLMIKPWVALSYLGLIVVSYCYWDKPVAEYFFSMHVAQSYPWVKILTNLGWGGFYIPGLLLLSLALRFIFRSESWRPVFFVWLCVVIPSLVALVVKIVLARARPSLWLGSSLYGFQWLKFHAPFWSFPSGHTVNIMGLVFGASWLYPRCFKPLLGIGLLVVATRIALLAHYLSDVLAAMYLSLIVIGLMQRWLHNQSAWKLFLRES